MLSMPIKSAIKTTTAHAKRLKELGIQTVEDFLLYFPHRYTDQREVCRIADVQLDQINTVRGHIASLKNNPGWRGRGGVTTALITDESGSIEAVWFNQTFLARTLAKGIEVMVSGKVKHNIKKGTISFQSPQVELVKAQQIHTARIVPVYHETELGADTKAPGKISSKWIREKLFPLLPFANDFPEFLPTEILTQYSLMAYPEAIKNAHFPESEEALDKAKKRLAFNELFLLQLAALHRRALWRMAAQKAHKQIPTDWELIKSFTASLPFALTNAQKKAIFEIIKDLANPFPMSRLLEGDTGSGKTVVAGAAILATVKAEFQCALLAPTEILARQHAKTLTKILAPFKIIPELLLGATATQEKKDIIERLKKGELKLVIGTHALLQETIGFKNLGLAIIDEQHRFGVKQRELLKLFDGPHILSLTATPIPRTLALILYGDQDLSILDEMPAGRQIIITRIVEEKKRTAAYTWIADEIKKGRQAFIIFPLIEESEMLQVKSAVQEYERLQREVFPGFKLGLLHGQMSSEEKQAAMKEFSEGRTHILVSTAVVEVGVDVPNATIMMIEGAERFGLAQLHQFRGRVGRGSEQSYCLLFPSHYSPDALKRLLALVKYNSGFKLAEVDLQLRGPGQVFGTAQSGIPDLRMASLGDATTIKLAREAVEMILEKDPMLNQYPVLKEKIAEQENVTIDY